MAPSDRPLSFRPFLLLGACGLAVALVACTRPDPAGTTVPGSEDDPVSRVLAVATAYVDGYYEQYPEQCHHFGYPDLHDERLGDLSLERLGEWQHREEGWLATLQGIDTAQLAGTEAEVVHAYALERLQASVDLRVCRRELWNVSPTLRGFQINLPAMFGRLPVETEEQRTAVLARTRDLPRYIDTEIANLRVGLELGYTAARPCIYAVVRQIESLLQRPIEESPFFDPALRTEVEGFSVEMRQVLESEVRPALERYRDFLLQYAPAARQKVGVAANPDGGACYQASIRFYTSLYTTPQEIHQLGLDSMEHLEAEMRTIAERSFDSADPRAVLELVRSDPRYTFASSDEILDTTREGIERARAALPEWFGFVPSARVEVRAFPAYQKRTGSGLYRAGSADGSQPALYELGTHDPGALSRAGLLATAFHETYPGHHMHFSVAGERGRVHPMILHFYNHGMGEGWALYAERLADEMGLYQDDVDRLGLLSNEALRAARLVVDPGLHVLGWSRQQAIDYLLAHTSESPVAAAAQIDRYLADPGQSTSYLLGRIEVDRLREQAEQQLGERFDIRQFHDLLLEDGAVTLPILRTKIERWLAEAS